MHLVSLHRRIRAAVLLAAGVAWSCAAPEPEFPPTGPPQLDRMQWWREARFGLLVEWSLSPVPVSREEYAALLAQFDPTEFDADAWVRATSEADAGFLVVTTKHHDGFCFFDSVHTEFDVMSTPLRRDLMLELARACVRAGSRLGWSHSITDWQERDFGPGGAAIDDYGDYGDHVVQVRAQVRELLTRYGTIDALWFDGEAEESWSYEHSLALYELCRQLQPNIVVNDRVAGAGDVRELGDDPGQVPLTGRPGVDWAVCAEAAGAASGDLVRALIDTASKGGSFLLVVSPGPSGAFSAQTVERLHDVGRWMKSNGEALRGTSAGPFPDLAWGRCTQRVHGARTRLYLHVFDWPQEGRLTVPGLGNRPRAAYPLVDPERALPVEWAPEGVTVHLDADFEDECATVVVIEVDGPPTVYRAPRVVAASEQFVSSLSVALEPASPDLEVRYTLDGTPPGIDSLSYSAPFELIDSAEVRARSFFEGRAVGPVAARRFTRVAARPAARVGALRPGLAVTKYVGNWNALPDFAKLDPVAERVAESIGLGEPADEEFYGLRFAGYLRVPTDELYAFALTSDAGSRLWIDGELVVDNDGLHALRERRGSVALAAGPHAIAVEFFNKRGVAALDLRWGPAGGELASIAPDGLGQR